MKISREWLQTFFEKPLPEVAELEHMLTFHAFEIDGIEGDVLDVKITPNRGHDALSYRGVAKEIAAILNIPLKDDPLGSAHAMTGDHMLEGEQTAVRVHIESPELCPRYIAGYIKGVQVGPSPDWLKQRLERMGQQSINNVVDATNYVMFHLGQPMHAFDAGKLQAEGGTYAIEVRAAKPGEKMLALDDKEYELAESNIVIGDAHAGVAIGVAGVKGGKPAGISGETKDIIIESANFNGVSVRKTAQALKLRTDASSRFEQVISPELAGYGMRAAAELIKHIAGGELIGFVDAYPKPQEKKSASVSVAQVNQVLGTTLSEADVEDVFTRLGFSFEKAGDTFTVAVPFERLDLEIPEDLVEEVGRIVGYDKAALQELSSFSKQVEINQNFAVAERVREELMTQGYSEVYTSVFAETGERAVSNKIGGDKPYLRANLTDGLTEALKKNIPNKDLLGLAEIKLFEIGTVWQGGSEVVLVGMVTEKEGASEKPLTEYMKDVSATYAEFSSSETERYQPFSRYPYMVRDVALWTPQGTDPDAVMATIKKHAGELLVRAELFDRFEKGDKVSFAFRLVFQSFDRTLMDEDANSRMKSVHAALEKEGFEIR